MTTREMPRYTDAEYTTDVTVTVGKVTATFHVEILPAIPEHRMRAEDMEPGPLVASLIPMLRITTWDTYDDSGPPVVIRKREYTVDDVYQFVNYRPDYLWQRDARHYGSKGYQNGTGGDVPWRTPTRDLLEELMEAARDSFVADNPGWTARSVARKILRQISDAKDDATDLRRKADRLDQRAEALWALLPAVESKGEQA